VIRADLYVDDDNAGAQDGSALRPYRTVQQAINAAKDKAVIAVAGGNYPQNISVSEKAVRLYGGYVGGTKASYASGKAGDFATRDPAANPSHLKGDGKDSVVTLHESGASIVDGFLVTGGGRSSLARPQWMGGGFYIWNGAPTISNSVIEKNQTCPPVKQEEEKFGGGIYATGATISILNNVIRNNVSGRGAGIAADAPKAVIRGNIVQNNVGVSDHGGGIYIFSPNAEISYNRIIGNEIGRALGYGWGGGIIVYNKGGNYKLSHNIYTGNFAATDGSAFFVDEGGVASMDHDLFYANAPNPAGDRLVAPVYVDGDGKVGSTLHMNHVTIADHNQKPAASGHAITVEGKSKLTVNNSILWNNGGEDINLIDKTGKATVTYTLGQKVQKGTGNLSKDPLFANPAGHDYRPRSTSPAIDAADPASPFNLEPAPNGGRADLGAFGNTAQAGKAGKDDGVVKDKEPGQKTPKTDPSEETPKTYLLRGTAGELPSEAGDDSTKMTKVASKELGGTAVQIELIDTFGQKSAKVEDWTPFHTLRLDIVSQGEKELEVGFNLFHSGTKDFATRVVAPFVLKPGKNEVRIAVKDLKNTGGSPAKLAEVRRWYVASETPVTLLVGDIFLEGKAGEEGNDTKETSPGEKTGEKTSKTYLLRGTAGELPSEAGDDSTKMTKVTSKELGGTAVQIELIDTFGQKSAKVEDWTPFHTLSLDIVNQGPKELEVGFNLFHSGTKDFATRVVAPFVLKPGKNEVRIAVKDLKNTGGSPAKLAEVRRWYVASETPVTLLVGDIYLEGKAGSVATYTIKTDPARLERIRSAKMPKFTKPVPYNTPEADAIMSAAEIFPADNPWNTLVADWPVHPNSSKMIASVGADKFLRYNQDMAFVIVPPGFKKVDVKLVAPEAEESDPGPYPVPDNTPIEGWPKFFQEDPELKRLTLDDVQRGKPDLEQDRHGIVFDPVSRKLYEFYRLTKTDKGWQADQASIFDLSSNKLRPDGWTSSDAAGLPILPAIVRYDEIKRGVIDHALRFTVRRSRRAYVYPATHYASTLTDENLPRMGERFRLRKDFDTSKFSPEVRVILEALKRYGMLMADNGMDWGLSVSADERLPVFHEELRRIKGSDFDVVTPPPGYVAP
jgi:hypothetical protein